MDDTELWLTMQDKDFTQLASEMQDIALRWEQLLYTAGGALELEKCFLLPLIGVLPRMSKPFVNHQR